MKIRKAEAFAKVNLTLDVLKKRADGFHDMRMVMQSVTLADTLTLKLGGKHGIGAKTNRRFLPQDQKNLAVAAALKFREATGQTWEGLSIEIRKKIPVCAGTAGGSSDAAAVIRALNDLTGAGLSLQQLMALGSEIGSDVPYCILGGTALAEGRGEVLTPLPSLPACWFVLCKPRFYISTPELFRKLDQQQIKCRPDTEAVLSALSEGNLEDVARGMCNVFEEALSPSYGEELERIRKILLDAGALGACMSGTGPTVFGIFHRKNEAEQAVHALKWQYTEVFLAQPV